jgi:hypothetical protein
MSQEIQLNEQNCIALLKKYVDQGYKSSGKFGLADGALLHKCFRFLVGTEPSASLEGVPLTKDRAYELIFNGLNIANTANSFTLDDAAVISKVLDFLRENVLTPAVTPAEPEEKIREL